MGLLDDAAAGSERSGFVLLVTGPSGAGKGSLLGPLLAGDSRLQFSVSCTTRLARPGEVDGREYHFIDRPRFEALRDEGAFLEWAEVHGHLYGTRRKDVEGMLQAGRIPVLDIDVQGGLQVLQSYAAHVVSVFLFPPSWEELERRLTGRATDDEEAVRRRLTNARGEVGLADRYSYWLVNDDLDRARRGLEAIIAAEGLRRERYRSHPLRQPPPDG